MWILWRLRLDQQSRYGAALSTEGTPQDIPKPDLEYFTVHRYESSLYLDMLGDSAPRSSYAMSNPTLEVKFLRLHLACMEFQPLTILDVCRHFKNSEALQG